jgi:hypothetical protein
LIVPSSDYEGLDVTVFPGIVGLPNLDDDNGDGQVDWEEDGEGDLDDENDLSVFFVTTPAGPLGEDETIRLSMGVMRASFVSTTATPWSWANCRAPIR